MLLIIPSVKYSYRYHLSFLFLSYYKRKISKTHFKNDMEKCLLVLILLFKYQIMFYSFKEFEKVLTDIMTHTS